MPDVRLAGGNAFSEGRVEIFYKGVWGPVCDDGWGSKEAQVVCRSLGLGDEGSGICCSAFGESTANLTLDNVRCSGNESSILDCFHTGLGRSYCDHGEEVGVKCHGKLWIKNIEINFAQYQGPIA